MVANILERKYADYWLVLTRSQCLQDGDSLLTLRANGDVWKHFKYWLCSSNVLLKHWTSFPKDMLINSKTRYLLLTFLLRINFSLWQISVNTSLLASENYLLHVNFQKFYHFNIFLHLQLFVISILSYLNLIYHFKYVLI